MSKIAFAFDLHNTIVKSNEAWVEAYVELGSDVYREYAVQAVYRKTSRKFIAEKIGVSYDAVYEVYCQKAVPDPDMIALLDSLKGNFPLFLISSASERRVYNDLKSWNGEAYFEQILTKETFCKDDEEQWKALVEREKLDLLVYVGNDAEEDIVYADKVFPLISGKFLGQLQSLGYLWNRTGVEKHA